MYSQSRHKCGEWKQRKKDVFEPQMTGSVDYLKPVEFVGKCFEDGSFSNIEISNNYKDDVSGWMSEEDGSYMSLFLGTPILLVPGQIARFRRRNRFVDFRMVPEVSKDISLGNYDSGLGNNG